MKDFSEFQRKRLNYKERRTHTRADYFSSRCLLDVL